MLAHTFTITVPEGPDVPWLEFFDRIERYSLISNILHPDTSYNIIENICGAIPGIPSLLVYKVAIRAYRQKTVELIDEVVTRALQENPQ